MQELRTMQSQMDRAKTCETISGFLSIICQRDLDAAKQAGPNPTMLAQLKTKREQIFEELNQLIAYTKRLEIEIKRCLDTPARMFRIMI